MSYMAQFKLCRKVSPMTLQTFYTSLVFVGTCLAFSSCTPPKRNTVLPEATVVQKIENNKYLTTYTDSVGEEGEVCKSFQINRHADNKQPLSVLQVCTSEGEVLPEPVFIHTNTYSKKQNENQEDVICFEVQHSFLPSFEPGLVSPEAREAIDFKSDYQSTFYCEDEELKTKKFVWKKEQIEGNLYPNLIQCYTFSQEGQVFAYECKGSKTSGQLLEEDGYDYCEQGFVNKPVLDLQNQGFKISIQATSEKICKRSLSIDEIKTADDAIEVLNYEGVGLDDVNCKVIEEVTANTTKILGVSECDYIPISKEPTAEHHQKCSENTQAQSVSYLKSFSYSSVNKKLVGKDSLVSLVCNGEKGDTPLIGAAKVIIENLNKKPKTLQCSYKVIDGTTNEVSLFYCENEMVPAFNTCELYMKSNAYAVIGLKGFLVSDGAELYIKQEDGKNFSGIAYNRMATTDSVNLCENNETKGKLFKNAPLLKSFEVTSIEGKVTQYGTQEDFIKRATKPITSAIKELVLNQSCINISLERNGNDKKLYCPSFTEATNNPVFVNYVNVSPSEIKVKIHLLENLHSKVKTLQTEVTETKERVRDIENSLTTKDNTIILGDNVACTESELFQQSAFECAINKLSSLWNIDPKKLGSALANEYCEDVCYDSIDIVNKKNILLKIGVDIVKKELDENVVFEMTVSLLNQEEFNFVKMCVLDDSVKVCNDKYFYDRYNSDSVELGVNQIGKALNDKGYSEVIKYLNSYQRANTLFFKKGNYQTNLQSFFNRSTHIMLGNFNNFVLAANRATFGRLSAALYQVVQNRKHFRRIFRRIILSTQLILSTARRPFLGPLSISRQHFFKHQSV